MYLRTPKHLYAKIALCRIAERKERSEGVQVGQSVDRVPLLRMRANFRAEMLKAKQGHCVHRAQALLVLEALCKPVIV